MNHNAQSFWAAWFWHGRHIILGLERTDIMSLSLVCTSFFKILKPNIENWFIFKTWACDDSLVVYRPREWRIKVADIKTVPRPILDISLFNLQAPQSGYLASFNRILASAFHPPSLLYSITLSMNSPLSSITKIHFGDQFNAPVDNLPATIKTLTFGVSFNQPINHLPPLEDLALNSFDFDQSLDRLPRSLLRLYIVIGDHFHHYIDYLPPSLILLELYAYNDIALPLDHLPHSLLYLRIGGSYNHTLYHLPPNLDTLDISLAERYDEPLHCLPKSLKQLSIHPWYTRSLDHLPWHLSAKLKCYHTKPQKWEYAARLTPHVKKALPRSLAGSVGHYRPVEKLFLANNFSN